MNKLYLQLSVFVLLFLGEALSIYAEMLGARTHFEQSSHFLSTFWRMFLVITFAGALLISGYMLGFVVFQNIWIVSAVSITSILIIEPILAWVFFSQLPTKGSLIGFALGAAGLIITLIY